MRIARKHLFPLFWLLVYLFVAQISVGNWVLCFDLDGSVALEAGTCSCRAERAAADLSGALAAHLDATCKDILPSTESHLSPEEPRSPHYRALESTHPRDRIQSLYLSAPIIPSSARSTPSLHLSVRTTVLLI